MLKTAKRLKKKVYKNKSYKKRCCKKSKKVKSYKKKLYKKRNYKGGSTLESSYVNGGLLSTGYSIDNINPYNSALANPIPFSTYSKCP